jgi:hypothetical protein
MEDGVHVVEEQRTALLIQSGTLSYKRRILNNITFEQKRNVIESDGTLILIFGSLHGGTELTKRLAERYQMPLLGA